MADEERPHPCDEFARLARLSHCLDEMRYPMQISRDEANDELIILRVEPIARKADVVGKVLRPISHSDLSMLAQDL